MSGVRIEVVADAEPSDGRLVYRGRARTENGAFEIEVQVDRDAASARVLDEVEPALKARLEKLVGALVRAATRAELTSGRAPPRKIVRWRELDGSRD